MDIQQVLKENKEGFSINVKSMLVDTNEEGYYVSLTQNPIKDEDIEEQFLKMCKAANVISSPEVYVGYWSVDEENGFLDISVRTLKKDVAIKIAELFNQRAIYSAKEKTTIEAF